MEKSTLCYKDCPYLKQERKILFAVNMLWMTIVIVLIAFIYLAVINPPVRMSQTQDMEGGTQAQTIYG